MGVLAPEGHVKTTSHTLLASASTNSTVVKAAPCTLYSIVVSSPIICTGFLKLYNKASAPTLASDHPVLMLPLPATAGGIVTYVFTDAGMVFDTGLSFATTLNAAENDANNNTTSVNCHVVLTYSAVPVQL